jgi:hypothetical protein
LYIPPAILDATWLASSITRKVFPCSSRVSQIDSPAIPSPITRQVDIGHWKEQNPDLARSCRIAAEALVKVQNQYIHNLTEEVADNRESLHDSDYYVGEFVDRFGPRLAHLNGLLTVMSQLSAAPPQAAEKAEKAEK